MRTDRALPAERTGDDARSVRTVAAGRGQTTVDFVVGVALFVVAVAVVVGFVPQLFEPYDDAETTVVADRVADDLARDLLADSSGAAPGALNESCTAAFFDSSGPRECTFASSLLHERFGVDSTFRINVTVEWNEQTRNETTEVLCYDDDTESVEQCASGSDRLAAGPSVPADRRSVAAATRVARVDGRPVLLRVRVWSS